MSNDINWTVEILIENKTFIKMYQQISIEINVKLLPWPHYEKKLTKNIRPTDILQIYTSI